MKSFTPLCCVIALLLSHSSIHAELYKWKDAQGNTQYGDRPPANVITKPFDLPKITVIEKYADQWKPRDLSSQAPAQKQALEPQVTSGVYSKLEFLAPKSNQQIRANDGDVSAMISLKPPLKKGHKIVFSIDGKSLGIGTTRTKNFSNLNHGNHTANVKVVDENGTTMKNSSVSFNVLRTSSLSNTQSNQATKAPQAQTYNDARQQQRQ